MSTLNPHILTAEEQEYVNQLDELGKRLHEIAIKQLESSYFVKRTHGFKAWIKKQQEEQLNQQQQQQQQQNQSQIS
jgi:hypothetical protein